MEAATRRETCEDRIGAHLASRMVDLRALVELGHHGLHDTDEWSCLDTSERIDAINAVRDAGGEKVSVFAARSDDWPFDVTSIYEYGLSFDYVCEHTYADQDRGFWRYQLSWGGPSDEFRFYVGASGRPYSVEYRFHDWYDGAGVFLTGGDKETLDSVWYWFESFTDGFDYHEHCAECDS